MYVVLIIIDNIENCRIALKATLIHLLTYHLVVEISVPTGGDIENCTTDSSESIWLII